MENVKPNSVSQEKQKKEYTKNNFALDIYIFIIQTTLDNIKWQSMGEKVEEAYKVFKNAVQDVAFEKTQKVPIHRSKKYSEKK